MTTMVVMSGCESWISQAIIYRIPGTQMISRALVLVMWKPFSILRQFIGYLPVYVVGLFVIFLIFKAMDQIV